LPPARHSASGKIDDAQAFAFAPPAVFELGNATGFDLELLDNANQGHDKLVQARNQLLGMARKDPQLRQVRANGLDDERNTSSTSTGKGQCVWADHYRDQQHVVGGLGLAIRR